MSESCCLDVTALIEDVDQHVIIDLIRCVDFKFMFSADASA